MKTHFAHKPMLELKLIIILLLYTQEITLEWVS